MSEEYQWIKLGYKQGSSKRSKKKKEGIYFQKREIFSIYDSEWTKDLRSFFRLQNCQIRTSKNSGPIAITDGSMNKGNNQQIIAIYSCSGKRLSSFNWNETKNGKIFDFGFNEDDDLIIVSEKDGTEYKVHVFDLFGKQTHFFSIKREISRQIIWRVNISNDSIIILTESLKLYQIKNLTTNITYETFPGHLQIIETEKKKLKQKEEIELKKKRIAEVVDPKNEIQMKTIGNAKNVCVFISLRDSFTISKVTLNRGFETHKLHFPIYSLSVSQNGSLISVFSNNHNNNNECGVWVSNTDFNESVSKPITNQIFLSDPNIMEWCGSDCVCLYWQPNRKNPRSKLVMVGPTREVKEFRSYIGPLYIESEIDGLKIISSENYDFLHSVCKENKDTFKLGSLENSAVLFDSYLEFSEKRATSIKKLRNISSNLKEAVMTCLRASEYEYNPKLQTQLLNAASYGKSFISSNDSDENDGVNPHDEFVKTCDTLRVLNSIRSPIVGIPLSKKQYETIGFERVVIRLCKHHHHLLAYNICKFLKFDSEKEKVLISWAKAKVCSSESDQSVLSSIKEKCGKKISYASVAKEALIRGKKHLASNLLNFEDSPSKHVPILLSMETNESTERALEKAIESGITSLVHHVVLVLKRRYRDTLEFIRCLYRKEFSVALDFYLSYLQEQGGEESQQLLRDFYYYKDLSPLEGNLLVIESFKSVSIPQKQRLELLREACEEYKKSSEYLIEAKMCELQTKLHIKQHDYDSFIGKKVFFGLSVISTIENLIKENFKNDPLKECKKLKSTFKISDAQFHYTIIRVYGELGKWSNLRQFASSKKSPVGYQAFVDICEKYEEPDEVEYYKSTYLKK